MFAKLFLAKGTLLAALVFVAVAGFFAVNPNPASAASLENWWAADGSSFSVDYTTNTISSPGIRDVGDRPWEESWGRSEVAVDNNSFNLFFRLSTPQRVKVRIFHAEPFKLYVEKTVVLPAGARRIRLDCLGIVDPHAFLDVEHGYAENVGDAVTVSDVDLREIPKVRVVYPDGGESLVPGPVSVEWVADSSVSRVNIDLLSDGDPQARLATGVEGTSFVWSLDTHWPTGSAYRVRVTDSAGSGAFDDGNGLFTINGESKIVIERPVKAQVVRRGEQTTLRWRYSGIDAATARVMLLKGTAMVAVLAQAAPLGGEGVEGIGRFVWSIPADLAPGADYHIRVVAGKKAGRGPAFKIE